MTSPATPEPTALRVKAATEAFSTYGDLSFADRMTLALAAADEVAVVTSGPATPTDPQGKLRECANCGDRKFRHIGDHCVFCRKCPGFEPLYTTDEQLESLRARLAAEQARADRVRALAMTGRDEDNTCNTREIWASQILAVLDGDES